MRNTILFVLLALSLEVFSQGKFASPAWASVIGKSFKTESDLSELKDFQPLGVTSLTGSDDPERKSIALFIKGTTVIALFEVIPDGTDKTSVIDVIEIKNVLKTQDVKIGECRDGMSENPYILALVNKSKKERVQAVKAWYINLDKIRIESLSPKNITCTGNFAEDRD